MAAPGRPGAAAGPRQIPATAGQPVPAGRAAGHPPTAAPGGEHPGASLADSLPRTDPHRVHGRQAGDANGGADVTCGRRRDGASWLAQMSIRSGRYVPSSENSPGQPVALECPQRPRGGVRAAAEFVRQFRFRRQPGPHRVLAAPDPPREHGVNVLAGPRVLPRIIHDSHTGSVNGSSPCGLPVLHLEHPRVAAPTDGVRAGDDLARSAADARVLDAVGNA